MKKTLAILLAVLMAFMCCAEENTAETTPEATAELEDGEILMHGYISPYANYYIGVPAEWAIIGAGSTTQNLSEASTLLEDMDVYGYQKQLSADNDVLYCCSEDGKGLILAYGDNDGASNDVLVNRLQEFEDQISAACPGVTFNSDSGTYTYNSLFDLLYIHMNYKGREINQYYMVSGTSLYIFTFFGTTTDIAETVLSTFSIQSSGAAE